MNCCPRGLEGKALQTIVKEPLDPEGKCDILIVVSTPAWESTDPGRLYQMMDRYDQKTISRMVTGLELAPTRIAYVPVCQCFRSDPPDSEAIAACRPRLLETIQRLHPRFIIGLGSEARHAIGPRKKTDSPHMVEGAPALFAPSPRSLWNNPEAYAELEQAFVRARDYLITGIVEIPPPYDDYVILKPHQSGELLNRLADPGMRQVALDLETTGLDPQVDKILTIALSWTRGKAVAIPWSAFSPNQILKLGKILSTKKLIIHNALFDLAFLWAAGVQPGVWFDTMLAHYLLDERPGTHGLKRLATIRYKAPAYLEQLRRPGDEVGEVTGRTYALAEMQSLLQYNAADADYTFRLWQDLSEEMGAEGRLREVHDNILIPATHHFLELQMVGVHVDVGYLDGLEAEWKAELASLEKRLRGFPGAADMNFRSPKQVSAYLYDTLGLAQMATNGRDMSRADPDFTISVDDVLEEIQALENPDPDAVDYWRTASTAIMGKMKRRSTATYMLWWLSHQHEFPRLLVRHRILAKYIGVYIDGTRQLLHGDRVHPVYRLHGARTGRLSSTHPNIHGTPKKKVIKDIYAAPPGWTIVYADYSQAEIRMVAHYAEDKHLLRAMAAKDIHTEVAKRLFGMTDEQLASLPEEERTIRRRAAKTIAFGLIYGRGARSLAPQLGVEVEVAERYMEAFFQQMPAVKDWMARQHQLIRRQGYVESLWGRRRHISFFPPKGDQEGERQAGNFPIQSAVSDMTLLAHMRVVRALRNRGIPTMIYPHVHDSIQVCVPAKHEAQAVEIMREEMHDPGFATQVHFAIDIQTGASWGHLKTVFEG